MRRMTPDDDAAMGAEEAHSAGRGAPREPAATGSSPAAGRGAPEEPGAPGSSPAAARDPEPGGAAGSPPQHTNRLANETSPYLLQHAHNPVDWYPWGKEALQRARSLDRPIFLSIGYAACHWCHVMERESFEDEATARDLNDHFVAIKVDREERPDLDAIYMDAVHAMTGRGGWPMSMFLTPDGRPFYGGTYFPNRPGLGLPPFRDVLRGANQAWTERRNEVEEVAARLAEAMDRGQRLPAQTLRDPSAGGRSLAVLDAAAQAAESEFDASGGGWGSAPKFPQAMTIEFLLRESVRTGDARPLAMARRTLDAMADGGIHDQVGGGFARYSTDARWLVPHFEKMLYDNAQLARVYAHAWQLTDERRYADVARRTLDFMAREMRNPEHGGFASSLDADTGGEEGATYVWTAAEIRDALGERDAELFGAAYGVTENGNWEGRTILSRVRSDEQLAGDQRASEQVAAEQAADERRASGAAITPEQVGRRLADARRRLAEVRDARPQPRRDDKVLAAWNGLALAAFADAAVALDEPRFATVATEAADFLLAELRDSSGRLRRSWKDGRALHGGVLEDYTHLAEGLLCLYQATFDERWFAAACQLMDVALEHFADPAGGFFDTPDDGETLVARPRGLQDNALPSGGAMAATVFLKLHSLTGQARYRGAAEAAIGQVEAIIGQYPTAFAQWLTAYQLSAVPVDEIAIVGAGSDGSILAAPDAGPVAAPDNAGTVAAQDGSGRAAAPDDAGRVAALLAVARRGLRPFQVVALCADPGASAVPLMHDRVAIDGVPTAYVCRGFACRLPVTEPEALATQLDRADGTIVAAP